MRRLVYGICREKDLLQMELPIGLDGQPVTSISAGGLAAVCSEAPSAVAPCTSSLKAYAQVIELLHEYCTTLPLRWGCVLDSPGQVVELLCRRRCEFEGCLRRVDGCMEMGLRIHLDEAECYSSADTVSLLAEGHAPGTAYLLRRLLSYAIKDVQRQAETATLARLREAFEGLFVHSAAGPASAGPSRLLSVAFLVPRAQGVAFQQAFERLRQRGPGKMFLTGPWPPYTFVADYAEEPHL